MDNSVMFRTLLLKYLYNLLKQCSLAIENVTNYTAKNNGTMAI